MKFFEEIIKNKTFQGVLLVAWAVSIGYGIYANHLIIKEKINQKTKQNVE